MQRQSLKCSLLAVLAMVIAVSAAAVVIVVTRNSISGRVLDTVSQQGIAGLTIRLSSPRQSGQPIRITVSNSDGSFQFTKLTVTGKYLLEVSRGLALIYRKEVDTSQSAKFTIALRRLPR
jgi:hypothetical protein